MTAMKLSKTQRAVLERMAAGEMLECGWARSAWGWELYPSGDAVRGPTWKVLHTRGYVSTASLSGYTWQITPAGRAALDLARRGEGAIVRSEKNRDRMRRCPAPDGSPTRFYTRH